MQFNRRNALKVMAAGVLAVPAALRASQEPKTGIAAIDEAGLPRGEIAACMAPRMPQSLFVYSRPRYTSLDTNERHLFVMPMFERFQDIHDSGGTFGQTVAAHYGDFINVGTSLLDARAYKDGLAVNYTGNDNRNIFVLAFGALGLHHFLGARLAPDVDRYSTFGHAANSVWVFDPRTKQVAWGFRFMSFGTSAVVEMVQYDSDQRFRKNYGLRSILSDKFVMYVENGKIKRYRHDHQTLRSDLLGRRNVGGQRTADLS